MGDGGSEMGDPVDFGLWTLDFVSSPLSPHRKWIPGMALLAACFSVEAQIVNPSFEDDPWPTNGIWTGLSGWIGGFQLGQPRGTPLVSQPGGPFGGNILVPAASPIGVAGNCSAGLWPNHPSFTSHTLFQQVTLQPGRAYELTYWAQSMNLAGVKASLQARVLDGFGATLAEVTNTPGLGGSGATGFRAYTLYVPPIPGDGGATIEFSNLSTNPNTEAAVDAVAIKPVPRRSPPDLDLPIRSGNSWMLAWSDSIPAPTPQTAPSPNGPWSDVSLLSLRVVDGKRWVDLPADAAAAALYLRTVAP